MTLLKSLCAKPPPADGILPIRSFPAREVWVKATRFVYSYSIRFWRVCIRGGAGPLAEGGYFLNIWLWEKWLFCGHYFRKSERQIVAGGPDRPCLSPTNSTSAQVSEEASTSSDLVIHERMPKEDLVASYLSHLTCQIQKVAR